MTALDSRPATTTPTSVFARYIPKAYPHNFSVSLHVGRIAGGIPTDPRVAEGWIRTKLGETSDDAIRAEVATVMAERAVATEVPLTPADKAKMEKEILAEVNANRHLNGFKRKPCADCPPQGPGACENDKHLLYIEGRQAKAAIKEAANVRWPKDRWGPSRKGTVSFFAEHVFVQQDQIPLGVVEPTEVNQRFVHTWRGSGIQYEEIVADAQINFTLATDYDFTAEQWGLLWLTGEQQGIGATRSQGFGRYVVTKWERI
jgi:hypothetical protein